MPLGQRLTTFQSPKQKRLKITRKNILRKISSKMTSSGPYINYRYTSNTCYDSSPLVVMLQTLAAIPHLWSFCFKLLLWFLTSRSYASKMYDDTSPCFVTLQSCFTIFVNVMKAKSFIRPFCGCLHVYMHSCCVHVQLNWFDSYG